MGGGRKKLTFGTAADCDISIIIIIITADIVGVGIVVVIYIYIRAGVSNYRRHGSRGAYNVPIVTYIIAPCSN